MSNIHGLYSNKKDSDDEEEERENRYVGGVDSRGGGSGLAVEPTHDESGAPRDSIFQLASEANNDDQADAAQRRTIIMYRDGFQVDDGPYRRLDDAQNADFLRSLAQGRTPRELVEEGDVTVNLVDKRSEDYVETFRSFSGSGAALGSSGGGGGAGANGTIDPSTLPSPPPPLDESKPTTSIQVKLLNGKRKVVKINLDSTVATLASMLEATEPFRLVTGFPPAPLTNLQATIDQAGLKGAQVMMQKA